MRYPSRFARDLARKAAELGFEYEYLRGGHIRFKHPLGGMVTASATPSCPFALKNALGDLRRAVKQQKEKR